MSKVQRFATPHEEFWAGEFGDAYIERNQGDRLLASNLAFLTRALRSVRGCASAIEFGANIGMNLRALRLLFPGVEVRGIEINARAAEQLSALIGEAHTVNASIYDAEVKFPSMLSMAKGVLIHLDPDRLPIAYDRLYGSSSRYILIAEYYNPTPIPVQYRGHADRMFKRDFAGEMLERFKDLELIDYGFCYHRDPIFPQDDITWFLLEKRPLEC